MASQLTEAERRAVAYALRHSRGRYAADRASQLSGVPKSTIYDWRRNEIYLPDYSTASPVMWSYRDLVLLRLLAWLRQGGMQRPVAARQVKAVKKQLSSGLDVQRIHATKTDVVLRGPDEDQYIDDRENLLPSPDFYDLLATFDLHEPIQELRSTLRGSVWAPDLVAPSDHSSISPWVLAGDPCIARTRIPTSAIYALRTERNLPADSVVELYPGLTAEAVHDVTDLERRLRGNDDQIAA